MIARRYRLLVAAVVAIAAVVFLSMAIVIASQAPLPPPEDLIIGTWRLNVAKSKYSPGPPPKSETRTYERGPGGLKATIKRVYADGMVESLEYLANLDSVNPVTGSNAYDTVRMKRINEYESEAVLAHASVIFGVAIRTVSRDGKTMTISFRRESQVPVYNRAVYEKQTP